MGVWNKFLCTQIILPCATVMIPELIIHYTLQITTNYRTMTFMSQHLRDSDVDYNNMQRFTAANIPSYQLKLPVENPIIFYTLNMK
jgi:hypothetical protein